MSKPFKSEVITAVGANDAAVGEVTFLACGGWLMRVYADMTSQPDTAVLTLTDVEADFEIMSATKAAFTAGGGSLAVRMPEHEPDGTELTSTSPYYLSGIHNSGDRSILAELTLGDAGDVTVKLQFAGREAV